MWGHFRYSVDHRSDQYDRSDRGAAPVWLVPGCEVCRFSRSLPCFISLAPRVYLWWFSSSITIPHFIWNSRGWVRNWEIGRTFASAKVLIASHSPPSGRLFGPSVFVVLFMFWPANCQFKISPCEPAKKWYNTTNLVHVSPFLSFSFWEEDRMNLSMGLSLLGQNYFVGDVYRQQRY